MTVIALSASYPCRRGAPLLTAVNTDIFRLRYFTHCMACGFCADSCCAYGVDVDMHNVARLRAAGPDFEAFIGVPSSEWFTSTVVQDHEFPSGSHVRTAVKDGACVFLERQGRGCKIHSYCLTTGLDYHHLKPMVSILFPLTFELGVLTPSNELSDDSLVCAGQGPTLYAGVRAELLYYFGDTLVDELDRLALSVETGPEADQSSADQPAAAD